jgi:hypothetical protein
VEIRHNRRKTIKNFFNAAAMVRIVTHNPIDILQDEALQGFRRFASSQATNEIYNLPEHQGP